MEQRSHNDEETRKIADNLLKNTPYRFFCLYGELGAGKTAFTKGIARSLQIPEKAIKSPTFTIVREYPMEKGNFYHYDFYRSEQPDELLINELLERWSDPDNYFCIEWADRIENFLPKPRVDILLEHEANPDFRLININHYD